MGQLYVGETKRVERYLKFGTILDDVDGSASTIGVGRF